MGANLGRTPSRAGLPCRGNLVAVALVVEPADERNVEFTNGPFYRPVNAAAIFAYAPEILVCGFGAAHAMSRGADAREQDGSALSVRNIKIAVANLDPGGGAAYFEGPCGRGEGNNCGGTY